MTPPLIPTLDTATMKADLEREGAYDVRVYARCGDQHPDAHGEYCLQPENSPIHEPAEPGCIHADDHHAWKLGHLDISYSLKVAE